MSPWELQLPIGSTGNPDTESSSQLQGCDGYQDADHLYFFTESGDGALVSTYLAGSSPQKNPFCPSASFVDADVSQ